VQTRKRARRGRKLMHPNAVRSANSVASIEAVDRHGCQEGLLTACQPLDMDYILIYHEDERGVGCGTWVGLR